MDIFYSIKKFADDDDVQICCFFNHIWNKVTFHISVFVLRNFFFFFVSKHLLDNALSCSQECYSLPVLSYVLDCKDFMSETTYSFAGA